MRMRGENMKRAITEIILILLFVGIIFFGPICCKGNQQIWDGFFNSTNTYNYAEVKMPDGTIKEGRVELWKDYKSDAVKIIFEDGTDLITSYNCAVLSKEKVRR